MYGPPGLAEYVRSVQWALTLDLTLDPNGPSPLATDKATPLIYLECRHVDAMSDVAGQRCCCQTRTMVTAVTAARYVDPMTDAAGQSCYYQKRTQ